MFKKVVIGSIVLAAIVFNISFLKLENSSKSGLTLLSVKKAGAMQGEIDMVTIIGSRTYVPGGSGSPKIVWLDYWCEDPLQPTETELAAITRDYAMYRQEKVFQVTSNTTSNTVTGGGELKWNFIIESGANGGYSHTVTQNGNTHPVECCLIEQWGECTHLPTCESYGLG